MITPAVSLKFYINSIVSANILLCNIIFLPYHKKSASALIIAVQTGGASTKDLGNTVSEANRC